MRVGVDVMGGDNAPEEIVSGCIAVLDQLRNDDVLVLAGPRKIVEDLLKREKADDPRLVILDTPDVIGMAESPVEAVRSKRDSSIVRLAQLASRKTDSEERLDAWLSAGNTGACVTASAMYMRRLKGVHRPGIVVTVPTFAGPIILVDVGANIEPKPHHLAQYGVMGSVYAEKVLGIENPRVALMNVGGEEQKGTADMKQARDLLRATGSLNFKGYIEGRGVFNGEADVIITDGMLGNVMLKLAEGLSTSIIQALAHEVGKVDPDLAQRVKPVIKNLYTQYDYHEYGGAPLMGANGYCIISHGSSKSRTICNTILRARQLVEIGMNETIIERLRAQEEVTV
ncbi:MAG: phosphate acyltransferase PlsX [Phycisphaerales bacterium]|nr:phosphate acyltransferase PlsX [Phycisphaerales bacterium]